MSRFRNKVAVVAGAEHPLGVSLCTRLAAFGAMVVALGRSETALQAIARRDPVRINHLALRSGRQNVFELLRDAWGDEPLDIFIDLFAMSRTTTDAGDAFRLSAGLSAALSGGLSAGGACCVTIVPLGFESVHGGEDDIAKTAAYDAKLQHRASMPCGAKHVGLRVHDADLSWTEAQCISAGDMVLTLLHPVCRGLKNGSIVDWEPEAA